MMVVFRLLNHKKVKKYVMKTIDLSWLSFQKQLNLLKKCASQKQSLEDYVKKWCLS